MLVIVTAPVEPDTAIPAPAAAEVTAVVRYVLLSMVSAEPAPLDLTKPEPSCVVIAPTLFTLKSVVFVLAVEEPIAKRVRFVSPVFACIEKLANGDVVPTPTSGFAATAVLNPAPLQRLLA